MNAARIKELLNSCDVTRTWLVMEGDWGGQIYLTVRLDKLGKDAESSKLLAAMDKAAWESNEGGGTDDWCITTDEPSKGVPGGMGGGELTNGVWIHDEFNITKWRKAIRDALKLDKSTRISH